MCTYYLRVKRLFDVILEHHYQNVLSCWKLWPNFYNLMILGKIFPPLKEKEGPLKYSKKRFPKEKAVLVYTFHKTNWINKVWCFPFLYMCLQDGQTTLKNWKLNIKESRVIGLHETQQTSYIEGTSGVMGTIFGHFFLVWFLCCKIKWKEGWEDVSPSLDSCKIIRIGKM